MSQAELAHAEAQAARADLEGGGHRVEVAAVLGGIGGDLVAGEILGLADAGAARDQGVEVGARDAEGRGGAAELEAVLAERGEEARFVEGRGGGGRGGGRRGGHRRRARSAPKRAATPP
jgi:hypothetical protein